MISLAERMIAGRYLRSRRKESFISVITGFSLIGIALGVATLIVVTSVMNGVKEEMLRHFVGLTGHVQVYGQGRPVDHYQELAAEIAALKGVVEVTPVIEGQVMLTANGAARGAQVRAFPPSAKAPQAYLQSKMVAGNWEAFQQGSGMLAGERLGAAMGLGPDSRLTLISPEGRQTVVGLMPRMKAYPVAGLFKFGMQSIDANLVIMPFDEAQTYFKLNDNDTDRVTGIEIKVERLEDAPAIAKQVAVKLGQGYVVVDWRQSNAAVFEALNVQRLVMSLILMLIILVAAFNIIASLMMLVKDKQRDIAVLRALGLSRASVQRVFVGIGLTIGAVGTAIGVGLGLLIAVNIDNIRLWIESVTGRPLLGEQLYFLASLPAEVDPAQVIGVAIVSLGLSLLATLYPARRAAKLDPAEALRYE